jgi:hypothetical protein
MNKLFVVFVVVLSLFNCVLSSNNPPPPPAPPKFPNIGYIGYGYNIFYGNPHATNDFDPGFGRNEIFALTYDNHVTTADGLWTIPDHVSIPGTTDACTLSSEGITCSSSSSYQTTLKADCSADFSGFGAAFSANVDYQNVQNETESVSDVFVSTKGACEVYKAYVNQDVHPPLTQEFITVGSKLPTVFNASLPSALGFWSLFELYGTHYLTETSFGARWGYLFESTSEQYSSLQQSGINIGASASYDGLFIHAGVSTNDSSQYKDAQTFDSETTSFYQFSLGNPPPQDGDLDTWENQTIHSAALIPISYQLLSIDVLFGVAYTTDRDMNLRQNAVHNALYSYCSDYLLPNSIVASC